MKESTQENLNDESKLDTQEDENPDLINIKTISKAKDIFSNYDYIFSVCLIGNSNVGKTSLLTRFCDNYFKETYINTIGVDFKIITLNYKDSSVKLHLWDTAGQERFKSIAVNYYRNVHGFYFVYDLSNRESFEALAKWVSLAKAYNKIAMVNFLIANKNDLQRQVSQEEGREFAEKNNLVYYETSARNDDNVENSFFYMTFKLIEYYSKNRKIYDMYLFGNHLKTTNDISDAKKIPTSENKKKNCC